MSAPTLSLKTATMLKAILDQQHLPASLPNLAEVAADITAAQAELDAIVEAHTPAEPKPEATPKPNRASRRANKPSAKQR